jgi:type IV secretory pathway VirB10-like protein
MTPAWELTPRGDAYFQIRISRNTLIAIIVSLLIHAMLLIAIAPHLINTSPAGTTPDPIVVRLNPPTPQKTPSPPAEIAQAQPEPQPEQVHKPKPAPRPVKATNPVMAVEKPAVNDFKVPANPPRPAPSPDTAPPTDMMAYVNAARARRQATENYAAQENAAAVASERQPTDDEIRAANIKRNLQSPGANGVFQIINVSARTAQFSFRGWTSNYSNSRRELIEVEAGPDGDIQRAIVRRMIELIRNYYQGDFNWESQRLGRTVILSARKQDNDGLEDFLIQEFWGRRGVSP